MLYVYIFVAMKFLINIAIISDGEYYSNEYETFLPQVGCLEMLRNIIRSNFQRHGSMFPLTYSEIAWKTLNAIMLKILLCWWTSGLYARLKWIRIFVKHFSLINVKNLERNVRNQLIFYDARNAYRTSDTGTSPCISFFFFFNHPTSIKWFAPWTQCWKHIVKPFCGNML